MTHRVAEENIGEFHRRLANVDCGSIFSAGATQSLTKLDTDGQHPTAAWANMGIDEGMIDWCNKIAEAKRGKTRKYWKSAAGVLRSLENKAYQDVSKPVKEWIEKIHAGIRRERFKQGERQ